MNQASPKRLYRTRRWYRWTLRALALAAALLSTVLLAESTGRGVSLPGCAGSVTGWLGGCGEVLGSVWSRWLGIPVALLGVGGYVGVFGAALFIGPGRPPATQRRAWRALAFTTVMCGLSALWFVLVQGMFLEAWCVYCTAVHGMGVVLAGLVFASGHVGRTRSGLWAAAGGLPVLLLILGQTFGHDLVPTEPMAASRTSGHGSGNLGTGIVADTGPGGDRALTLAAGSVAVRLRPHELPVLGSPDAEHLMVYVYDYGCGFCRQMAPMLDAAMRRYNGEASPTRLGIVLVPAPRPGACEAEATATDGRNRAACEGAELILTVAAERPDAVELWHDRLVAGDVDAVVQAWDLARSTAPDPAVAEQALAQRQRNARLREMLGGVAPQLLVGRVRVQGRVPDTKQLFDLLDPIVGPPGAG